MLRWPLYKKLYSELDYLQKWIESCEIFQFAHFSISRHLPKSGKASPHSRKKKYRLDRYDRSGDGLLIAANSSLSSA